MKKVSYWVNPQGAMMDTLKKNYQKKLEITGKEIIFEPQIYKTEGCVNVRSKSKFYQS